MPVTAASLATQLSGGPMPMSTTRTKTTASPRSSHSPPPSAAATEAIAAPTAPAAGKSKAQRRQTARPRTLAEAAGGTAKLSPFTLVLPRKTGVAPDPLRLRVDFHDECAV